jgi:hypothetical protein
VVVTPVPIPPSSSQWLIKTYSSSPPPLTTLVVPALSHTASSLVHLHTIPARPSTPTPVVGSPRTPKSSLPTCTTSPSALSGLLPAADEAFRHSCPHRWYGNTYHTRTPRQWAVQFLGLTLTRAYARHLYTAHAQLLSGTAPLPSLPHPGLTAIFRYSRRQVVAGSR